MHRLDPSRRELLATLAAAGAAALVDPGPVLARLLEDQSCAAEATWGTLLGTLPLFRAGAPEQPFGVKLGGPGLDARLVTDLSKLEPDHLITANALAFVRTERPPAAARVNPWTIRISDMDGQSQSVSIPDLERRAQRMGAHLLECSGNNNPANFGLMSVSEWDGVPLTDILSLFRRSPEATSVVVSGMDFSDSRSRDSVDGASWILPLASLDRPGPFLALRMNGDPIPPDHGSPVRLVVPGWYGCTWIKWVNDIRLAGANEPATSQMKEFAARTHQTARHDLAREYTPADIQVAATPVRVEKRRPRVAGRESRVANHLEYRIIGIVWGGDKPVDRLAIRLGAKAPWIPFPICPPPTTAKAWSLWDYRWKPLAPGTYDITLSVPDRSIPQRRLDSGYYTRQVRVEEI